MDDILLIGNDVGNMEDVKEYLSEHIVIKDLEQLRYVLGIEIAS